MPIGRRILIVDDAQTVRQHMRALLTQVSEREIEVMEASTAENAVREFRRANPDLVILDMRLKSKYDGLAVLKLMLKERPEAQIVLFTALDRSHAMVEEAISLGAIAYIQKPPSLDDLERLLQELERRTGGLSRVK